MTIPTKAEWLDALTQRHGAELQSRFSAATVAICGLGGLGSGIAVALARAGIGTLVLIDFDRVDLSNLHRQQYKACQLGMYKTDALTDNLREIAPYLNIRPMNERITEKNLKTLLKDADIVCEAFDVAEEKAMLINGVSEQLPHTILVAASGMAGLESANNIRTRKITNRFWLCGDETSDVAEGVGLVSTRVAVCAAHQAHAVLRVLAKQTERR